MKYVYVIESRGDIFTREFENAESAVKFGEADWNHMTEREKKMCEYAHVLESVNPDEEAPDHFDGDFVKVWK